MNLHKPFTVQVCGDISIEGRSGVNRAHMSRATHAPLNRPGRVIRMILELQNIKLTLKLEHNQIPYEFTILEASIGNTYIIFAILSYTLAPKGREKTEGQASPSPRYTNKTK